MTVDALTPSLTVAERDTLADCEATIQRGMQTFIEVGNALMTIRNNRLYRAEFGTFEDYCNKRWRLSAAHSCRLIDAATVAELISSPMGEEINISERQAVGGNRPSRPRRPVPADWTVRPGGRI